MFVLLSLSWLLLLMLQADADLDRSSDGMQLQGDFSIAGLFPLHYFDPQSAGLPALAPCREGEANQHGFHMMQAMRFAVEEINNGSGPGALLPGVKLGYQMYDVCSEPYSVLAALDLVEQHHNHPASAASQGDKTNSSKTQTTLAVIGPDSSSRTFTPATLLGAYFIPQISYEASNEQLSNKAIYPSFFRTIPSDKNQVAAMIQILVRFGWTWVALLGSDNAYGLQGMEGLAKLAPDYGICIAYQGVIPAYRPDTVQAMRTVADQVLKAQVGVVVVFSSRTKLKKFIPFLLERNVTGKVWIGTEDWSASSVISRIPGVHTIGTVIGVAVKYVEISGFEEFERRELEASMRQKEQEASGGPVEGGDVCLQSSDLDSLVRRNFSLEKYDITSSFNVYKAVYAVAHALHRTLDCNPGGCSKRHVHPWELLHVLKQVRFSLENSSVYFDANGDPPTGYDIITWIWRGTDWTIRIIGSFTPDPVSLTVDAGQIEWFNRGDQREVPASICSPPCPKGHRKLLTGQHSCCFDCLPCPAATFLNQSDPTLCQACLPDQWAPPSSEECLERTVLLLSWDAPVSVALLFFLSCCLLLTSSCSVVFLLHLDSPVVKSAGGRSCLLMLAALTAAALSSLCHFGRPSPAACVLKQPLFVVSVAVVLACVAVRSLQVVCIFKFASRLPPAYDRWAKKRGPEATILLASSVVLVVSVLRLALNPPRPSQDLDFYPDSVVLECSRTLSAGAGLELGYVSLLSALCFAFSYAGKDLPANYNEAKCVTFSLLVYMMSWMSFFTLYLVSRDPFTMAAHVFATLFSVLAFFAGYFLPKIYIIVLKPHMNTTAHFQNCIQMYTMTKQ